MVAEPSCGCPKKDGLVEKAEARSECGGADRLRSCSGDPLEKGKIRALRVTMKMPRRIVLSRVGRDRVRRMPQEQGPTLFNLQRFEQAQNAVIDQLCAQIDAGRKRSHWMWFIFPQIAGLGLSSMSKKYSIRSRAEAEAYLQHPRPGTGCATAHKWCATVKARLSTSPVIPTGSNSARASRCILQPVQMSPFSPKLSNGAAAVNAIR